MRFLSSRQANLRLDDFPDSTVVIIRVNVNHATAGERTCKLIKHHGTRNPVVSSAAFNFNPT
jgi:hypothetical protein